MSTPPPVTSRPYLTDAEHAWAFVAGGGMTLIIIAFSLAAMRLSSNETLLIWFLVPGVLALIGGTIGWLVQLQPWKNFDDLTTPYYTGHAHDDHADHHDDSDDHLVQAAIADLGNVTVGEPYAADFAGGHIEKLDFAPATQADLTPPPVILDPMSAFPEPAQDVISNKENLQDFGDRHVLAAEESKAVPPPPTIIDPISAFPPAEPAKPAKPSKKDAPADDLTQLKGIGPKINGVLKAAGIMTFAQLAEQKTADLEQLVRAGDVKSVIHPESWIEDAKKVVAGDRSVLEHTDKQ